jgi:hypothetical protein
MSMPTEIRRVVTVSTANFGSNLQRLLVSLERTNPELDVRVYCPAAHALDGLVGEKCEVIALKEMATHGVRRAKFAAYRHAAVEGGFIYLDADIVVLESLSPLTRVTTLAGCPDDLSACPIPDRSHPWPGDPSLEARRYINGGVLVFPPSARDFVELAARRVADGRFWSRYVYPGLLYDNHVLCALLNLENVDLVLLDERVYNWPGFRTPSFSLEVRRSAEGLVNIRTGRPLRLMHFAGVQDVDAYLASLPLEISSLIHARSLHDIPASVTRASQAFQATLCNAAGAGAADQTELVACDLLHREAIAIGERLVRRSPPPPTGHVSEKTALLWTTYAVPDRGLRWNGLRCGGAYLEGDEYNYLVEMLTRQGVRSVVSTGAGETTILFQRLGLAGISIEPQEGPWLDRALASGGACALVNFDQETLEFDDEPLSAALAGAVPLGFDLLFVDSPAGTRQRSRIVDQFLRLASPPMILFHDAFRDVENVYECAASHGFQPIEFCRSVRGLVLLTSDRDRPHVVHDPARVRSGEPLKNAATQISVTNAPMNVQEGERFEVAVELWNTGGDTLTTRSLLPVVLSYHWYDACGVCIEFEGERTALPFDIPSGTTARFPTTVVAPDLPGRHKLLISAVQESVFWFHDLDGANGVSIQVSVGR